MAQISPPKVLIVAPNASSRFGGEAFLPLKYFQLLRRRGVPAKLIAHSRNRDDLSETLADCLDDVFFVEDSVYHRAIWRVSKILPSRVMENLSGVVLNMINESFQARIIRKLIRAGQVDIIHQPIPVSPLAPSTMHRFGVPYIIGPMNGGMTYPAGYEYLESRRQQFFVNMARRMARVVNRLVPGKFRATTLLVANKRTRNAISFLKHPNVIDLVENGVDLQVWQDNEQPGSQVPGPFRLVYLGRLLELKAIDFTLRAVDLVRMAGTNLRFDILGDGPERTNLEDLTQKLELNDNVTFHGFLPQAACADILRQSDALILNSVRECGGAVVLEAMSMGLPVIIADWGGPADYVDPDCGILVAPVPKESFAERLAEAITRLEGNPKLRQKMGTAGAQKVRDQFDWEKKVDRILEIYDDTLQRG